MLRVVHTREHRLLIASGCDLGLSPARLAAREINIVILAALSQETMTTAHCQQ
jgi:hypothetical protein